MVGQEILVLFIMVRIRAPQPKIKAPLWRFYYWSVATVRDPQRTLPVRKQVGEISDSAIKPPRAAGIECTPTKIKKHPIGVFLFTICKQKNK